MRARSEWRDLVSAAMNAVEELQASTALHTELLREIAEGAERRSAQVTELKEHTLFASRLLTALQAEFDRSAVDLNKSIELSRSIQASLAEFARLISLRLKVS